MYLLVARRLAECGTPDELLARPWAQGLSVVGAADRTTFCFTSAYGKTYV